MKWHSEYISMLWQENDAVCVWRRGERAWNTLFRYSAYRAVPAHSFPCFSSSGKSFLVKAQELCTKDERFLLNIAMCTCRRNNEEGNEPYGKPASS
jgi:hypothetical protein